MDQKALFLKFWDSEAKTTRKVLARIPDGSLYTPDPKSRPAREIAWQITIEMRVLAEGIARGAMHWEMPPTPPTMKEVMEAYDVQAERLSAGLHATASERWDAKVPFMIGEKVLNDSATGFENAWGFLFDIIHHRGQITTYLRPMGSTVPQVYGPTADEP
jgi:uncharacterized damage-inducible protein DinB